MGSRRQTEQLLLDTVLRMIIDRGFDSLRVNNIASKSGVNKALIYRYFGGLEGLLEAFAASQDFWPEMTEILGDKPAELMQMPPNKIIGIILKNHLQALKKRPITIEIMAQECVERNSLTAILEDIREKRSMQLQQYLLENMKKQNISEEEIRKFFSLGAILAASLQYFLIRSRFIEVFGGLDIRSDEGHAQIIEIIEGLC